MKLNLSESEVSQEIDLSEVAGVDLSSRPDLKQSIGQDIIDRIVERTESGDAYTESGRRAKLKSPYSKEYADSLDFKAFGKSRGKVNMTLTGDMLGSLDLDDVGDSTIKIFVDPSQAPKGYNQHVGDTVPARPWFGISEQELKKILDKYATDLKEIANPVTEERQAILDRLAVLTTDESKRSVNLNNFFSFLFDEEPL